MFKILDEVCTPTKGSKYSACVDLYARKDVTMGAGETALVPLGVKIDLTKFASFDEYHKENFAFIILPEGQEPFEAFKSSHYLQLMLRSSLGKKGLVLPNGVGVIDLDYKDEIMMIIHNPITSSIDYQDGSTELLGALELREYSIKSGDKIAQITLLEHKAHLFDIESEDERTGGFGSTGK